MKAMPFQETLRNLLTSNEGGLGVLFLDETGEAVDYACEDFTAYELRVVGAYVRIYLRQIEKFLEDSQLGEPRVIHITKDNLYIYAVPLPEEYALAFVQRRPALVAKAIDGLAKASAALRAELF